MLAFRILGPFEVVDGDRPLVVGGPKLRALLAVLVLHRGEVVSTDRLIDALWGERASGTAAKTVQVYVSNLRRALGDGLVVTRGGGYALVTDGCEVDVERFEALVAEGRRALASRDGRAAGARLREALALWRGPPLADFAYEGFAQGAIARLEEERLEALEDRIDADLAIGEQAGLVGELEGLVAEHPLRERLRGQLMLALYRCGRQADALGAYRDARRELLDGLGLEPGRALQELERAILAQDPALDAPSSRHRAWPASARARGGALIVAGGALLLAAAIAAAAVALTAGGGGSRLTAAANSVAVIDPHANRVVADTPVGAAPAGVAAGVDGVWVVNTDDHTISNIDPPSRRVIRVVPVGGNVDAVAADTGALWAVDSTRGVASRIDPTFRSVIRAVPVGDKPGASFGPNPIAVGGGAVWVANNASEVMRITRGGASVTPIDVGNDPDGIAVGLGATWVSDDADGTVSRIDSTGGVSAIITVGPGASGIAVGAGAVWVTNTPADTLVRIDPTTDSPRTTIAVGSRPRGVAFGEGSVWVANSGDGTVSRVDPQTNRVIATIPVGQSPQALVVADGSVWVSVAGSPGVPPSPSGSPPGVLRVVREGPFSSTDPALAVFDPQATQMYYATCAGLLTYSDRPAPEGTRLVPDVAQGLPSVSADGRTYTFIVRPGFRFSSGAPVTAATFKHTIERAVGPRLGGYASTIMGDIVGMPAFQAGRTAHLAGVTASGDRLQIRLTAPSPDLPARIATLPFCAVPNDTPMTAQHQPIPSAGPYYIVSSSGDQLVLARNPNYGGRRPRTPNRIVYSFGVNLPQAIQQVTAGHSDYLDASTFPSSGQSPAAPGLLQRLEQRYGPASAAARTGHQRYFVEPWLDLEYFVFNTARPLFASARLRRAVNYAIDRRALVQHHFLFNGGRATDHYLVPGIPGARPVDVYPLGGPNLAKARALAQGLHAHATLYITTGAPQFMQDARILQADLAPIGITVDVTALPGPAFYRRLKRPGEPWDIAWTNWGADFADPFTMINELYDPTNAAAANFGRFNDPALTRRMRQAARLSGDRRLQAYAQLDQDLTRNDPPAAAWGNGTLREFFSSRVGCQVYQPIYGFDLGSLCLRR
ncbi:MAG: ABC transporter substrate-binding protein [Solirubrobacteraceae bacterium]